MISNEPEHVTLGRDLKVPNQLKFRNISYQKDAVRNIPFKIP